MATPMSPTTTSSNIRNDYMSLLITQLQNQNPLEPMSNDQMAAQLAQMSQLEQLEHQTTTFDKVLQSQEATQATAMIGKQVTYFPPGGDETVTATVDGVAIFDGEVVLMVGKKEVPLDDVLAITQTPLTSQQPLPVQAAPPPATETPPPVAQQQATLTGHPVVTAGLASGPIMGPTQ